jgi:hypothetical protein
VQANVHEDAVIHPGLCLLLKDEGRPDLTEVAAEVEMYGRAEAWDEYG